MCSDLSRFILWFFSSGYGSFPRDMVAFRGISRVSYVVNLWSWFVNRCRDKKSEHWNCEGPDFTACVYYSEPSQNNGVDKLVRVRLTYLFLCRFQWRYFSFQWRWEFELIFLLAWVHFYALLAPPMLVILPRMYHITLLLVQIEDDTGEILVLVNTW